MKIQFQKYILRNFKDEDASSILKYADNRKIWLNLRDRFPHPYSIDDAKNFLSNVRAKQPETFFAITSENEVIGSIGFSIGQDVHRRTAELGYWLAEPYWNSGITTEAIQIIVEYAFDNFNLVRIFAEPYSSNIASTKVLEKCGFEFEGRLKSSVFKDGKILDQLLYAKTINT